MILNGDEVIAAIRRVLGEAAEAKTITVTFVATEEITLVEQPGPAPQLVAGDEVTLIED